MMDLKHTKAILFDWDLTLVQPLPVTRRALRKVGKRYGVNLMDASLREIYENYQVALHNLHRQYTSSLPDRETFIADILTELIYGHRAVELVHGAFLERMRQKGFKMGLVTFNMYENVRAVLKKANFHFDVYMTRDDMTSTMVDTVSKTDCMRRAMKALVVTPRETVYVGDMPSDIRSSREAGIPVVAVTTGFYSRKELESEKPDLIIDHLNELEEIFS